MIAGCTGSRPAYSSATRRASRAATRSGRTRPPVSPAPDGDGWRLSGRKFYSTGSLFADWILTTATLDSEHSATVLVPTSAPA